MIDTNLGTLFSQLPSPTILVVGDLILDRYLWGNAERVSPEAPVLVLRSESEQARLGGAASVAALLQALHAQVILVGVIGNDTNGLTMRSLMTEANIDHRTVLGDDDRMTTTKERFIGKAANRHPSQILRVDHEQRDPISKETEDNLIQALRRRIGEADVVLISDYAKGVCTPRLLEAIKTIADKRHVPVFVDPARITDYERYRGVTLLVPNRAEAELATGCRIESPQDALLVGHRLCTQYAIPNVLVKLDSDGMALVRYAFEEIHYPAQPRSVYDVTGAGDMVLAIVGLCQATNVSWKDTVKIANVAAGLEVEQLGVTPITRQEICSDLLQFERTLHAKMVTMPQLLSLAADYRHRGKQLVFTNGCFDLLHIGHVSYLLEASRLGDVLIVAINSDKSVRRLKGPQRPLVTENDRARMLAALACVDYVLIFDEDTPHEILRSLQPDFLVKGGTYTPEEVVGAEIVQAYGGHVDVLGYVEGISTSKIIADVLSRHPIAFPNHVPETVSH